MNMKRCPTCVGSGSIMGGGMMSMDCPNCDGHGKIEIIEDEIAYINNVKSQLSDKYPTLSSTEISNIVDDAKPKRGRPKREVV